jgi:phytoene synthase
MQRSTLEPRPSDLAACRALLRQGSKSFYLASRLLPDRVRDGAVSLYAFCRVADDAIDLCSGDPGEAVNELRRRLDLAYAGMPYPHPADRAFAYAVSLHGIPQAIPEALIEGFAWDALRQRYATIDHLLAYAVRVAGTVGAMMAIVMGAADRAALSRAIDLGVAMQLTNIARDVGEDARAGRLYLPLDWLLAQNIDPDEFLAEPRLTPGLATVIAQLLDRADTLYALGDAGIALLPPACRPAIRAARAIYAEIGEEVRRAGCDSITRRAVVSTHRKAASVIGRMSNAAPVTPSAPAMPQAISLIEAVHCGPNRRDPARPAERIESLIDLFARLTPRPIPLAE